MFIIICYQLKLVRKKFIMKKFTELDTTKALQGELNDLLDRQNSAPEVNDLSEVFDDLEDLLDYAEDKFANNYVAINQSDDPNGTFDYIKEEMKEEIEKLFKETEINESHEADTDNLYLLLGAVTYRLHQLER